MRCHRRQPGSDAGRQRRSAWNRRASRCFARWSLPGRTGRPGAYPPLFRLQGVTTGDHTASELAQRIQALGLQRTLECMDGGFCIAVLDRRLQTLSLARDRMGRTSLYYGWTAQGFAFASELSHRITAGLRQPGRSQYAHAPAALWLYPRTVLHLPGDIQIGRRRSAGVRLGGRGTRRGRPCSERARAVLGCQANGRGVDYATTGNRRDAGHRRLATRA
ncbi:hypothetical protein [Xanthomonas vesicatoria]